PSATFFPPGGADVALSAAGVPCPTAGALRGRPLGRLPCWPVSSSVPSSQSANASAATPRAAEGNARPAGLVGRTGARPPPATSPPRPPPPRAPPPPPPAPLLPCRLLPRLPCRPARLRRARGLPWPAARGRFASPGATPPPGVSVANNAPRGHLR